MDSKTFTFKCPACRANLTIPVEYAGKKGQCNKCGTGIMARPPKDREWASPIVGGLAMLVFSVVIASLFAISETDSKAVLDVQLDAAVTAPVAAYVEPRIEYVPTSPPAPIYQYNLAHQNAALLALRKAGFPQPKLLELDRSMIVAEIDISNAQLKNLGGYPSNVAAKAVLAIRNSIYVMPSSDPEWSYVVKLNGESPGPDLEVFWGVSFLSGASGTIEWVDGGTVMDLFQ